LKFKPNEIPRNENESTTKSKLVKFAASICVFGALCGLALAVLGNNGEELDGQFGSGIQARDNGAEETKGRQGDESKLWKPPYSSPDMVNRTFVDFVIEFDSKGDDAYWFNASTRLMNKLRDFFGMTDEKGQEYNLNPKCTFTLGEDSGGCLLTVTGPKGRTAVLPVSVKQRGEVLPSSNWRQGNEEARDELNTFFYNPTQNDDQKNPLK